MTNFIYAEKGTQKTRFTAMVWKHMGANKNGWVQITKAQYDGSAPTGKSNGKKPEGLEDEAKYRQIFDQGKGFEADGKLEDALGRYEEALALKSSPALKGKITKVKKAMEAAKKTDNRNELVQMATEALVENDFELAIESLESAQEIEKTEETAAKIEEIKKKQADALVE